MPAAWKINDSAVSISSYNTLNGYVAKWTGIQPGADGDFVIRYTYAQNTPGIEIPIGASEGMTGSIPYGYGPGGFMLSRPPNPPASVCCCWPGSGCFAVGSRKRVIGSESCVG